MSDAVAHDAGDVGGHVDVLQVPEGLGVVEADGGAVGQGDPEADAAVGQQVDGAGRFVFLDCEALLWVE